MIDDAIAELAPLVGTRRACAAAGRAQASHYRRHRQPPPPARLPAERRPQPRALTPAERAQVRAVLIRPCAVGAEWMLLLDSPEVVDGSACKLTRPALPQAALLLHGIIAS